MKIQIKFVILGLLLSSFSVMSWAKDSKMKIQISQNDIVIEVELENNPTAKSLWNQLPTSVDLEDYGGMEKIFYPSSKLSKEAAPDGYKPSAGDVTCYGPWGNVAIFYKDFSYSKGLIKLGKITKGLNDLTKLKNAKASIVAID